MGTAERIARINATGTVNIARAFLSRAAEGDALVNVASTAGHSIPRVLIPLRSFRLAEQRPEDFEKAIVSRARLGLEENHGAGDLVKSAAIKRFGKPEEVAAVIVFCASEAPGYLTGVDILVDGAARLGWSLSRLRKGLCKRIGSCPSRLEARE